MIVSVGFNDGPPYPPDRPCHSAVADTAAAQVVQLLKTTPTCIDANIDSYRPDYGAVFGPIDKLAPRSSTLLALTV